MTRTIADAYPDAASTQKRGGYLNIAAMKNTITAAALALGLAFTAAAPAKALDVGSCKKLSDAVWAVATLRERGYGPQDVYDHMIQIGIDEEIAVVFLKLVYVDALFSSAQEIKDTLFTFCLAEET